MAVLFSQRTRGRTRGDSLKLAQGCLGWRSGQTMPEQAAQGSGGLIVPGNI